MNQAPDIGRSEVIDSAPVEGEKPRQDHRPRVAAQRRAQMRLHILQTSLGAIGKKGIDAITIDDFIAAARVSRGTLYNYFNTTNELLLTLTHAMSEEVLAVIKPRMLGIGDPLHRFSAGIRTYIRTAVRYPVWGRFVTRVDTRIATQGHHFDEYLFNDLALAMKSRRVAVAQPMVVRNLVLGTVFHGVEALLDDPTLDQHGEHLMAALLRGIGLDAKLAEEVAFLPLPDFGPVEGPLFSSLPVKAGGSDSPLGRVARSHRPPHLD